VLTPLQEQIRAILADVASDVDLALAGGAALVVSDVVDRPTNDLDLFARYPSPQAETVDLVQGALEAAGLHVTRLTDMSNFARLRVESGDDSTEVDLGAHPRIAPWCASDRALCWRWPIWLPTRFSPSRPAPSPATSSTSPRSPSGSPSPNYAISPPRRTAASTVPA
jgi:hypothetical protein